MRDRFQMRISVPVLKAATEAAKRAGTDRNAAICASLEHAVQLTAKEFQPQTVLFRSALAAGSSERTALTIECDRELLLRINRQAKTANVTRSTWIGLALAKHLLG